MLRLKQDLSGKDAVYLSNCHRYYNGLLNLELYRNPPDTLPSLVRVKGCLDRYVLSYEGAVNGDRVNIKMREADRKDLSKVFKQILYYLQSVANEDSIPALLQAGYEVCEKAGRRKQVTAVATS